MVAQLNHLFSMWDMMIEKHHLEKIKTYVARPRYAIRGRPGDIGLFFRANSMRYIWFSICINLRFYLISVRSPSETDSLVKISHKKLFYSNTVVEAICTNNPPVRTK